MVQVVAPTAYEQLPAIGELKTHNDLLGDVAALNRAWETDGYWFFRDVLDKAAVARLRKSWTDVLEAEGVVDPIGDKSTEKSIRYNGASLERFPFRMEPLAAEKPWVSFVQEPAIKGFFTRLFQDEPFWVPIVEYRATPPVQDPAKPRIDGIHQDGPYSPGIPFRICWIPLAEIDEAIGGLMLAEGMADQVSRHPRDASGSNSAIRLEDIPADRWRRTTYQAGDVLLMNLWTPHTGLTNCSDRFRLSMDHRVMARGDGCPIVGTIQEISGSHVVVRDDSGSHDLSIDADTYVRTDRGRRLTGDDIADWFRPGRDVIIAHSDGRATVVRPPH